MDSIKKLKFLTLEIFNIDIHHFRKSIMVLYRESNYTIVFIWAFIHRRLLSRARNLTSATKNYRNLMFELQTNFSLITKLISFTIKFIIKNMILWLSPFQKIFITVLQNNWTYPKCLASVHFILLYCKWKIFWELLLYFL